MTSRSVKMVKRVNFNFIRNWNQLINVQSISTLEHLLFNFIVCANLTSSNNTTLRAFVCTLVPFSHWFVTDCTLDIVKMALLQGGRKTIFWGRETVIYRLEFRSILTFEQISNSNWVSTGRKNGFAQICSRQTCSKIVTTEG